MTAGGYNHRMDTPDKPAGQPRPSATVVTRQLPYGSVDFGTLRLGGFDPAAEPPTDPFPGPPHPDTITGTVTGWLSKDPDRTPPE